MTIIMGLVGIVTLLFLAWLLSDNRKQINRRTVALAFALQVVIAALILYIPHGDTALNALSSGVQNVIDYANVGIRFLFGTLAERKPGTLIFAIHVLPIIVFFAALMATLYYLGVMQKVVSFLGGALHKFLKTGRTESMVAVANIFVGHTEAPLVIRPYLSGMTNSELFTVMTAGMATIAGAVMAGYAAMGIDLKYLLTASFMGAPGAVLMSKMLMPETRYQDPKLDEGQFSDSGKPVNIFEAIANGARDGLMLALNVGAMLLAFVAMIALLNGMLTGAGGWFGVEGLTFEKILGWLLAPFAYALGVQWNEAAAAGSLIGQKFVVNEFVAYINFVNIKGQLSAHTQVIITFALCGFANLSSIAMMMGGLGTLAPERRSDIARMGFRAVIAGTLSNLMSATLAGLFFSLHFT
ncbi:MAG: NupC/NupG family nucleoside CNT transporter [Steroidobacterales bacterium]